MTKPSFLRHSGWVSPEILHETVNIIGCGAVGSNVALIAAKMGFHKFRLWDLDVVEAHNLPNQAYEPKHINMYKVEALRDVLQTFNPDVEVEIHKEFFTTASKDYVEGVLVLATDTMKSRDEIYNVFEMNTNISRVFEIRLGFDYGELNIVDNLDPAQCKSWKALLVDDAQVPDGPCNLRICTTLVTLVSSYAVHSMCAMYVAESKGEEWNPKPKSIFQLSPELQHYAI